MLEVPHAKYFQGILQLRDCGPEIRDFVFNTTAHDRRAIIVREARVRGGVDLYFSSQRYLQSLGKKLKEAFPGILHVTATLHTISKTGKSLHRVTVLFRQLGFDKGDVIQVRGDPHRIIRMGENKIQVQNVASGAKSWIAIERVKRH